MPPQSVYGNRLACGLIKLLFGERYTDLGPFRAIDYRVLQRLQMCDRNFGWTIEMQIKASRANLRILEIPVPYRKRIGESKISGTVSGTIQAGYMILYTIAKHGILRSAPEQQETPHAESSQFQSTHGTVTDQPSGRSSLEPIPKSGAGLGILVLGALSLALYLVLAQLSTAFEYGAERSTRPIPVVLIILGALFGLYLYAIYVVRLAPRANGLLVCIILPAIAFRIVMLFSHPIQEVDLYRYIWDGQVVNQGVSPFRYEPQRIVQTGLFETVDPDLARLIELREERPELNIVLERVHFSELPTIYPPTSQFIFWLAAQTTPHDAAVVHYVTVMKAWLVGFDVATMVVIVLLLRACARPMNLLIAYAWCPLVIKEIANSGHLDSIAVFFTTLAVWVSVCAFLNSSKSRFSSTILLGLSAAILAIAVGAKLYPVILIPLLTLNAIRRTGWWATFLSALVFTSMSLVLLWPMLPDNVKSTAFRSSNNVDHELTEDVDESVDPSLGVTTFLKQWEINDLLFMVLIENIRLDAMADRHPRGFPFFRSHGEHLLWKFCRTILGSASNRRHFC